MRYLPRFHPKVEKVCHTITSEAAEAADIEIPCLQLSPLTPRPAAISPKLRRSPAYPQLEVQFELVREFVADEP
jgi:hypothetical protein